MGECILPDTGDAAANNYIGQTAAIIESPVPDAGDGVGDSDAGKTGAVIERIAADGSDAIGDYITANFSRRA